MRNIIMLILITGLLTACGSNERIEEQRREALVRKLFRQEKARLHEEADSLCLEKEAAMLEYLVDSFKHARIEALKEVSPY